MFADKPVAEPLDRHVEVGREDHQVARAGVGVVVHPVGHGAPIALQILGDLADLAPAGLDGFADAVASGPDRNACFCINAHAKSIAHD